MTGQTAHEEALVERYGWGPGLEHIAAAAPPLSQSAIDFLRADGFPAVRPTAQEQAS